MELPDNVTKAWEILIDYYSKNQPASGRCCCFCDRDLVIRNRSFNAGMARGLIYLYRMTKDQPPGTWLNLSGKALQANVFKMLRQAEYEKLEWWGLLEKREKRNDVTGKTGGFWRLTAKGIAFAESDIEIEKTMRDFVGQCYGPSNDKKTTLSEALRHRFSIFDLLKRPLDDQIWFAPVVKREQQTPQIESL